MTNISQSAIDALRTMNFSTPYGFGDRYRCVSALDSDEAAKHILTEICKDPHKYLPDEIFGPTLKDTLDMVAKIKKHKKEAEDLKAQLDKQDADFNGAIFQWMTALHEEVTAKLNAEDRAKIAELRVDTLEHEMLHRIEQGDYRDDRCEKAVELLKKDLTQALDQRDTARQQHKRADDWCAEVMQRLCIAGGVDWTDLGEEISIEDMEQALRDNIRLHIDDLYRAELQVAKHKNERDEAIRVADKMRCELAHLRTFDVEKLIKERDDAVASNKIFKDELWKVLHRNGAGTPNVE